MVSNKKEYQSQYSEIRMIGKGNYGILIRKSVFNIEQVRWTILCFEEDRSWLYEKRGGNSCSLRGQSVKNTETPSYSQVLSFLFGPAEFDNHYGVL